MIDAHERRDVMTSDVPNAFIQTANEKDKDGHHVIMKIHGILVDMLIEMDPELYRDKVVYSNGEKILYVETLQAIYGLLKSALLFYRKLRKDLKDDSFIVNPYNPCVANQLINDKQHTVTWHVDDIKSSHIDPKVNDKFHDWLEMKYGDEEIGKVKSTRGKIHDYLGMTLDYTSPGEVKIDMTKYVKDMVRDFPEKIDHGTVVNPATTKLFQVNNNSTQLNKKKAEQFHTFVAKGLFLSKRARPDINPTIPFLCTRVKLPTDEYWNKLV